MVKITWWKLNLIKVSAFVLIKENEFLICSETQDFAMVPYDKITYQIQDDADCTFAAIIAVLPDTPPNCIVIQVWDFMLDTVVNLEQF